MVTYTPQFPTINDTLNLIFDASKGNAALMGANKVYAHTGCINKYSVSQNDWVHKPINWDAGAKDTIELEPLGNNLHRFKIHIKKYYSIGFNEKVREIGFVFRNADGSKAGKNADGSNIYIHIYEKGLTARFTAPVEFPKVINLGENFTVEVTSQKDAQINLFQDKSLISQTNGKTATASITGTKYGKFWVKFIAQSDTTITDSLYYIVQKSTNGIEPPADMKEGINYLNDSTVTLCLLAPQKNFVYLIGDFNKWEVHPDYKMNRANDGERYWLTVSGIIPKKEYRFQYYVDLDVKVADPYADKVLDPSNDAGINSIVYPKLIKYPKDTTTEYVSIFQTAQVPFQWKIKNFKRPDNRDLVIYELLVRDFVARHSYQTIIDSLQYLIDLGVNAIELMPINEFNGNTTWGYDPAFFTAPDKYYGTREKLKEFIDTCHSRGIAIIQDIVFNHAFGNHPWVRMYWDRGSSKVDGNSPWFHRVAAHPYNVGYDFKHGNKYTQNFIDRTLEFWAKEYNVDGFRLDLSKGFTDNFTGDDVGKWGQYDAGRVYNIKRLTSKFWSNNPGKWIILEHFADNPEETELAAHGCMLWGKGTHQYSQAAKG